MTRGPVALGTLFELPLADFGSTIAGDGGVELTENALRQLQMEPPAQQESQADAAATAASAARAAAAAPALLACCLNLPA